MGTLKFKTERLTTDSGTMLDEKQENEFHIIVSQCILMDAGQRVGARFLCRPLHTLFFRD